MTDGGKGDFGGVGGDVGGDVGLAAALRRFPTHAGQIRTMLRRNDSFRGLCDDLAAAERALVSVDTMPADLRDERRAEYAELVDSLAAEIERNLRQIKIVSINASSGRTT